MHPSSTSPPPASAAAAASAAAVPAAVLVLLGSVFFDVLGVGLVVPLLPVAAQRLGAHATQVGLLTSAYGAAQLVGGPLIGRLSDRFGRKPLLCVSLAGAGLAYLLTAHATRLWHLFAARLVVGGVKQTMTLAKAYVGAVVPVAGRARCIGLVHTAAAAGFMVGPVLGGWLAARTYTEAPMHLSAALFGANIVCVFLFLPAIDRATAAAAEGGERPAGVVGQNGTGNEVDEEEEELPLHVHDAAALGGGDVDDDTLDASSSPFSVATLKAALALVGGARHRRRSGNGDTTSSSSSGSTSSASGGGEPEVNVDAMALLLVLMSSVFTLGFVLFRSNFAVFAQLQYGLEPKQNGYVLSYLAMCEVLVQSFAIGPLVRKFDGPQLLTVAPMLAAAAFAALSTVGAWAMLFVLLVPVVLASATFHTVTATCLTQLVDRARLGQILGVSDSMDSVARVIAPIVGGVLIDAASPTAAPLAGAVVLGLLALFASFSLPERMPAVRGCGRQHAVEGAGETGAAAGAAVGSASPKAPPRTKHD